MLRLKTTVAFTLTLILAAALAGCQFALPSRNSPVSAPGKEDYQVDEDGSTHFGFGAYKEPDGWQLYPRQTEAEGLGLDEKRYYLKEGQADAADPPTNISVEVASNRYSPEEHIRFRDGIKNSLMAQTQGKAKGISGSGTYSAKGYNLYIFTIEYYDSVTTQFYVVGDKKYFLVIATEWNNSDVKGAGDAAKGIADSFVWDDLPPQSR